MKTNRFSSTGLIAALLLASATLLEAQFSYTINNGAITITRYSGPGGAVSIPSTFSSWPVTSIGANAFASLSGVTSVTIPASITSIGETAFATCSSLSAITVNPNNPAFSSVAGVLFDKSQTTLLQYPIGNKAQSYASRQRHQH